MTSPNDLNALIGSRICHDLISPLGAIGNGVELLELSGMENSPELALISESVQNANTRIRFFRVAFGAASDASSVAEAEIRTILAPVADGRKSVIHWTPTGPQSRPEVKLAFLTLQAMETAMPWGGEINVACAGETWTITAQAERMNADETLWALLTAPDDLVPVTPAQVHYALIGPELARQGRTATVALAETKITVTF